MDNFACPLSSSTPTVSQNAGFAKIETSAVKTRDLVDTERETRTTCPQSPICTVDLYDFDKPSAYFEMGTNWKQCQGLFVFSLEVIDGCSKTVDMVPVDIKCNKPPIAVACCHTTVAWNPNTIKFPTVWVDGRVESYAGYVDKSKSLANKVSNPFLDSDEYTAAASGESPYLDYSWELSGLPRTSSSGLQVDPLKKQMAQLTPDKAGFYYVLLKVDDGCNTATDTVTIQAECIDLDPDIKILQDTLTSSGANCEPPNVCTGVYQKNDVKLSAAATSYGARGDRSRLIYTWTISTKPARSFNLLQSPASDSPIFKPDFSGVYTFLLTISDICQVKTKSITFTITCPADWVIPNPFVGRVWTTVEATRAIGTSSTVGYALQWDYDVNQGKYQSFTLDAKVPVADAIRPRYKYTFNVYKDQGKDPINGVQDPTTTSVFTFTPERTSKPASYVINVTITDGCQEQTFAMPDKLLIYARCGTDPVPKISMPASQPVQTGVMNTTFRYSVKYRNTGVGFYPLTLSCADSVTVAAKTCLWTASDVNHLSLSFTGETAQITPKNAGTSSITLRVSDGCPGSSEVTSVTVIVDAVCSRGALALANPAGMAQTATWNSAERKFDPVKLDGKILLPIDGPLRAGDVLAYSWSVVVDQAQGAQALGAGALTNDAALPTDRTTETTTFSPGRNPGKYIVQLEVSDGCQKQTFKFTITCPCLALQASIVALPSVNGVSGFRTVKWNGKRFEIAQVDGQAQATYAGRPDSLSFAWSMLDSPCDDTAILKDPECGKAAGEVNRTICCVAHFPCMQKACSAWGRTGTYSYTVSTPKATLAADAATLVNGCTNAITRRQNTTKTRSLTQKSTLEGLDTYKRYKFQTDGAVFTPDLKGKYTVSVQVTDGCSTSAASVDIYAGCNGSPNPIFDKPTQFVSLDGVNTRRVYVDASRTTDPENDALTYDFTIDFIDSRDATTTTAIPALVANNKGSIASFVPTKSGNYRVTLIVSDGCSSVPATSTIVVNCQASQLQLVGAASPSEVRYAQKSDLSSNFGRVDLSVTVTPACNGFKASAKCKDYPDVSNVAENEIGSICWSFVSMTCSTPVIAAVNATPPAPKTCAPDQKYEWNLIGKPCDSKLSSASISNRLGALAQFTPDISGTFQLQLTVTDTCSSKPTLVSILARCESDVAVTTGLVSPIVFGCTADEGFPMVEVSGSARRATTTENFVATKNRPVCTRPNPASTPTNAPTFGPATCCPACTACGTCQACPGCTQNCNCGNTRGWQYSCNPVTVTKQTRRRVSVLMEQRCTGSKCSKVELGGEHCPQSCVDDKTCACMWEAVMRNETVDVEEAKCDWVRVPIPGVFSSYSQKQRVFETPRFSAGVTAGRVAQQPAVSSAFFGAISTLSIMLIASGIINVVYWKKIQGHHSEIVSS